MPEKTTLSVRVNLTQPDAPNNGTLSGFQLSIEVLSAQLLEPEIFVFNRHVQSEGSDVHEDFFYSVASLAQMHSLPKGSVETLDQPFYRDSSVVLMFETYAEAEKARDEDIMPFIDALAEANDHALNNRDQVDYTVTADGAVEDEDGEETTEDTTE